MAAVCPGCGHPNPSLDAHLSAGARQIRREGAFTRVIGCAVGSVVAWFWVFGCLSTVLPPGFVTTLALGGVVAFPLIGWYVVRAGVDFRVRDWTEQTRKWNRP